MTWIRTIPLEQADGPLKNIYERIKGEDGELDTVMVAHSLRPHLMEGHRILSQKILNNSANALEKWKLDTIGVYVSLLNGCDYCAEYYYKELRKRLDDEDASSRLWSALKADQPDRVLSGADLAMILYANLLTTRPNQIAVNMIDELRNSGISDGEILEINQAVSYFSYVNRTVLGLGVYDKSDIDDRQTAYT
ncbi:carboxymuconolactone decarboxylase family protein [Sneathiella litorea]|uniref:Alkylhydroperoxidase n=1 Tax=Sneathiella litorea TaxID=2606216 RepID=A0A6L8W4Y2_9PROT|nr:alkylhydroperoxidase [Sneathiella litorea]MZR29562.1 alkylhydroperoxidase [Sneathiella litorea]